MTAFDPLRPPLMCVAYRMLGSVAEAEDIVQDAFMRWLDADRDAVREPGGTARAEAYGKRIKPAAG